MGSDPRSSLNESSNVQIGRFGSVNLPRAAKPVAECLCNYLSSTQIIIANY